MKAHAFAQSILSVHSVALIPPRIRLFSPTETGGQRDLETGTVYHNERAHHADPQDEAERGSGAVQQGNRGYLRG